MSSARLVYESDTDSDSHFEEIVTPKSVFPKKSVEFDLDNILEFKSKSEALKVIKDQNKWSYSYENMSVGGKKVIFRCKGVPARAKPQCSA
jgi:hypothetical protein